MVDVSTEIEIDRARADVDGRGTRSLKVGFSAACIAAGALFVGLANAQPAPDAPLPTSAHALAGTLASTAADLRTAIDAWKAPRGSTPPRDVTLDALYVQRAYRLLSGNLSLAAATERLLPPPLAAYARDVVTAHRELVRITPPLRLRAIRIGRAAPPDDLLRWYHAAEARFGVPWRVLAAVNFVESGFGRLRSASAAGAQGPMQFMPGTWRAYGLGGNVHAPHDAILGAANYLRASGAPRDIHAALHAYNPSPLYVDAVLRYARRIGADRYAFYELYSWQVYVLTASGPVRLTGPGRRQ